MSIIPANYDFELKSMILLERFCSPSHHLHWTLITGRWCLIQGLFSQQFSAHFSLQVELDQPPGDTKPVGFLYSMCDIRSGTEKHPRALGVISPSFKLAPQKAYIHAPACWCQRLPSPSPPRMDSQAGQDKRWASLVWTRLLSKAQGTEQTITAQILKTSMLLSFLTNLTMKCVRCCRSNRYWLLLNRAFTQHKQDISFSHASENGFAQTKVANLQKPSQSWMDIIMISS